MNMPASICAARTQPVTAVPDTAILHTAVAENSAAAPPSIKAHADPLRALPLIAETEALALRRGTLPAPSQRKDAAAFELLDRDERLIILLSRGSSRFSALGGRWTGALARIRPSRDEQAEDARALRIRHEALRRFAILYRLDRGGLAFGEEERLAKAGYSDDQATVIRSLVERFEESWSPPPHSWARMLIIFLLAIAGASLLYRRLATGIDDIYVASLLSIVIVTGIISFFAVTARPNGGPTRK